MMESGLQHEMFAASDVLTHVTPDVLAPELVAAHARLLALEVIGGEG